MPKFTKPPALIATFIASIAFVATLFAPWQKIDGVSYAGFSGWGIAAFVFAAFVAFEAAMQLNGIVKRIPVPPLMLLLLPAILCLITTILKILIDSEGRQTWAWAGLGLALTIVVAAYLNARELLRMLRQVRKAMAATKTGAAPAAPKPAAKRTAAANKQTVPASGGASCDGVWNISMDTPMGTQKMTLTLVSNGSELSGSADAPFGAQDFEDGTVDGDEIAWQIVATQPMPMTLNFKATISGDLLEGTAEVPGMGASPFDGTRA